MLSMFEKIKFLRYILRNYGTHSALFKTVFLSKSPIFPCSSTENWYLLPFSRCVLTVLKRYSRIGAWKGEIFVVFKADNYDVQNNIKMHHGPSLPRQTVVGLAKQIANMRVKYSDSQRSNLTCQLENKWLTHEREALRWKVDSFFSVRLRYKNQR